MSSWRKSALSSKLILASSATTRPSRVTMSGFTSTSEASVSQKQRYRPCSSRAASPSAPSGTPILRATSRASPSARPACGSTNTLWIFSGVFAATSSMSMPPSEEAISATFCVPRSTTRPTYSSVAMSAPSSMSSRRTFWPCGPVWCVTSCMPRIFFACARTSSSDFATFTPPPLPRPPAWICALTTHTLPPSCRAAATASSTPKHGTPRGVGTP